MKTRSAFTLLELLAVIAIMAVMMGAAVASFQGIGRGARMRSSVNMVRTAVGLARQQAILKGQTLEMRFFEDNGLYGYYMTNTVENYQVGQRQYLPRGIRVSPAPSTLTFQPTGSGGGAGTSSLELRQTDGVVVPTQITVYNLTGLVRVQ